MRNWQEQETKTAHIVQPFQQNFMMHHHTQNRTKRDIKSYIRNSKTAHNAQSYIKKVVSSFPHELPQDWPHQTNPTARKSLRKIFGHGEVYSVNDMVQFSHLQTNQSHKDRDFPPNFPVLFSLTFQSWIPFECSHSQIYINT